MFSIDYKDRRSIYEQLVDRIKALAASGMLPPGSQLPSVRQLSSELSINPNTVQKSYKLMEEEGILRTISNVKSVVYVDEQIMERLQQEMIQETVDDFIANCRECGLPFQKVVAILSTRWDI